VPLRAQCAAQRQRRLYISARTHRRDQCTHSMTPASPTVAMLLLSQRCATNRPVCSRSRSRQIAFSNTVALSPAIKAEGLGARARLACSIQLRPSRTFHAR
jgi:hypothetical protein